MLVFAGVAVSHTGLVRANNEDSAFLGPTCLVVADGVGGAAAGEVASATATRVLSALFASPPDPATDPGALLGAGVRLAQERLALGVRRTSGHAGMATTLTAVATNGSDFALAHVGDSRGFVLHEGCLTQVTEDHTYVRRLVQEGSLSEDEVGRHPWRHVLLRTVDGDVAEQGDLTALRLSAGDRVLLASDGLTDLVAPDRIESIVRDRDDAAAAQALLEEALRAGGRDNVTCVIATVVQANRPGAGRSDGLGELVGAARDPGLVVEPSTVAVPHSA